MGSKLSFSRSDGTSVSSQHSIQHSNLAGATRRPSSEAHIRSHSHMPSASEGEQTSSNRAQQHRRGSDGLTEDVSASLATFNRLMSELEASGIAANDPRLLRMLRHYRMDGIDRNRTGSLSSSGVISSSTSEGRRANRRRRMRMASATEAGTSDDASAGGQTLMHQAILQLAAASSSTSASSSRQRPWPESLLLLDGRDRRCVFCKRVVPHDDYDLHYVMCLTRPRVTYNVDKLLVDQGECSICLGDLKAGDAIARLPCLCIYHKACIDLWFQRKQTCPEHPGD